MLNTLDYIDSYIRTKVTEYFETFMTRLSYKRKLLRGEMDIYMSDEDEDGEEDWDIVGDTPEKVENPT